MCSHIPTIHNTWQIRDQASLESQKTAPSSGTMPSLPRPRTHFAHQFFSPATSVGARFPGNRPAGAGRQRHPHRVVCDITPHRKEWSCSTSTREPTPGRPRRVGKEIERCAARHLGTRMSGKSSRSRQNFPNRGAKQRAVSCEGHVPSLKFHDTSRRQKGQQEIQHRSHIIAGGLVQQQKGAVQVVTRSDPGTQFGIQEHL